MATTAENTIPNAQLDAWLEQRLDELLPQKIAGIETSKTPSMSIIATKGSLDWAYPPFILASTAAALGWDVDIFFTFYGLLLLKKDLERRGQPAGKSRHAHEDAIRAKVVPGFRLADAQPGDGGRTGFRKNRHQPDEENL